MLLAATTLVDDVFGGSHSDHMQSLALRYISRTRFYVSAMAYDVAPPDVRWTVYIADASQLERLCCVSLHVHTLSRWVCLLSSLTSTP